MTSGNGNHKTPKLLSTEDLAEQLGEKPGTLRKRRDRGDDLAGRQGRAALAALADRLRVQVKDFGEVLRR